MKIGFGYDVHRLIEGRKLILGGIEIPYIKGLLGHSDGDVLLHAICDALLGAASLGDIGEHFPDTDIRYQGICSSELLKQVLDLIKAKYSILHIDTVILADEPYLSPFKPSIRKRLREILNINLEQVNIKATRAEGLNAIGRKEAIACYAIALLAERKEK